MTIPMASEPQSASWHAHEDVSLAPGGNFFRKPDNPSPPFSILPVETARRWSSQEVWNPPPLLFPVPCSLQRGLWETREIPRPARPATCLQATSLRETRLDNPVEFTEDREQRPLAPEKRADPCAANAQGAALFRIHGTRESLAMTPPRQEQPEGPPNEANAPHRNEANAPRRNEANAPHRNEANADHRRSPACESTAKTDPNATPLDPTNGRPARFVQVV